MMFNAKIMNFLGIRAFVFDYSLKLTLKKQKINKFCYTTLFPYHKCVFNEKFSIKLIATFFCSDSPKNKKGILRYVAKNNLASILRCFYKNTQIPKSLR